MQFQDQGSDIHVVFYEIRNKDGSSGWLVVYNNDSKQFTGGRAYLRLVDNLTKPFDLDIEIGANATYQQYYPYAAALMTPDFVTAINTMLKTGIVPDSLNNGSMIAPGNP